MRDPLLQEISIIVSAFHFPLNSETHLMEFIMSIILWIFAWSSDKCSISRISFRTLSSLAKGIDIVALIVQIPVEISYKRNIRIHFYTYQFIDNKLRNDTIAEQ